MDAVRRLAPELGIFDRGMVVSLSLRMADGNKG